MDSSAPSYRCTRLLVCALDAGTESPRLVTRVPQEWLSSLEQLIERWLGAGDVICLVGRQADDTLLDTVRHVRLQLPAAALVITLDAIDSEAVARLIPCGVQEVFAAQQLEQAQTDQLCEGAVVRMEYEQSLRRLSHFDPLTGLAGRGLFQDRLEQSLIQAHRNGTNVGLLFIDLDRFRVVNDVYGHQLGDRLLIASSQRLQEKLRRSDTVARLGGNSFAVILDAVRGVEVVTAIAQKLIHALKAPFRIDGHEIFVTGSIGADLSCEANYDSGQMVRRTELALHQAKRDGRNGCQVFTPQTAPMDKIRLGLESALHHALERDELRLVYQPQVSVVGQHFVGAEVLLRWKHPVLGWVSPTVFIPVLEDTGLIEPFGEWVLRRACQQYKRWLDDGVVGLNSKISVNLSPRQFRQRDLGERIQAAIQDTGLPPTSLALEITESTLMYNLEQGAVLLRQLRHLGVSIAIDDFGTGYSSLAYLKDLPIDYLKIDRSFVKDIVTDRNDAAIANSIIGLAHNLGLKVVAEGVEEQDILNVLADLGCDQYQGYFFARPVVADELPLLIAGCD